MKAISLWQPWASLWLSNAKVHETRGWSTPVRGTIAVHAAQRLVVDVDSALCDVIEDEFGCSWNETLPRGAIIGTLELVDCYPTICAGVDIPGVPLHRVAVHGDDFVCGDFGEGRFAWKRGRYSAFKTTCIPWKGRRGWFDVPDDVIARAA